MIFEGQKLLNHSTESFLEGAITAYFGKAIPNADPDNVLKVKVFGPNIRNIPR